MTSVWSAMSQFYVATAPTLIPIALQQSTSRPTISWEPLPGAVKYDVWIDNYLAGVSQYIRNQNVTGTSFTPDSDMPLGLYRVWVRGIAQTGMTTAWSAMSQFYVVTAPTITGGNQSTFDRTPTFEWSAVTGAVRYEAYIRNSTTGVTVYYPTDLLGTSWTPPVDLPDGPYRWWAIAVGANNVRGLWSPPIDIHVGGRPNVLTPTGTTNNSTPNISWQAVDGAVRYELWVTNMSSMVRVIYDTNLTVLNFTPSTPLVNAAYRVWVRAVSSTGEFSAWSVAADFTIADSKGSDNGETPWKSDEILVGLLIDGTLRANVPLTQDVRMQIILSLQRVRQSKNAPVTITLPVWQFQQRHAVLLEVREYGEDSCFTDVEEFWSSADDLFADLNIAVESDNHLLRSSLRMASGRV